MKALGDLLNAITHPTFDHACPTCKAALARPGRCLECDAREAKMVTAASMPTRFAWACGLDAPELPARVDPSALKQARAIDLHSLDRLTLLGSAGAGKTSLATAIANAWVCVTSRPALFLSAVDIGVGRQQHGLGQGEARIVHQAMTAPLLVLDDLGQEPDIGIPAVAHVVQHRYDQVRSMIATSGLAVEQLVSRYGSGVTRRLLETAGGAIVLKPRSPGARGWTQS